MDSNQEARASRLGFVRMEVSTGHFDIIFFFPSNLITSSVCPVSFEEFQKATEAELRPTRVHENTLAFMFESSLM